MTITVEQAIYAFCIVSSVTTAVFWGAFLLGRLYSRIETVEKRMDKAGELMSDLTDTVQKMPDKFMTRREAFAWKGSRAEDQS